MDTLSASTITVKEHNIECQTINKNLKEIRAQCEASGVNFDVFKSQFDKLTAQIADLKEEQTIQIAGLKEEQTAHNKAELKYIYLANTLLVSQIRSST